MFIEKDLDHVSSIPYIYNGLSQTWGKNMFFGKPVQVGLDASKSLRLLNTTCQSASNHLVGCGSLIIFAIYLHPPKINEWIPKMMVWSSLQEWQFLVSMLDFWGVNAQNPD